MFSYSLLVRTPGAPRQFDIEAGTLRPNDWVQVRPGPDMQLPTIEAVQDQMAKDFGFVPNWLAALTDPDEYIGVEDEHEVEGVWFCACIEGSQNHVMPPLAQQIAFVRNHPVQATE